MQYPDRAQAATDYLRKRTDSYKKEQTDWEEFVKPMYQDPTEYVASYYANTLDKSIANEPSQDAPTITNELGGKQSKVERAYHLVPPEALAQVARVLYTGHIKYGKDNWRLIEADEHLNHAMNHIYLSLAGNVSEDHLAHAATRILMALELHTLGNTHDNH